MSTQAKLFLKKYRKQKGRKKFRPFFDEFVKAENGIKGRFFHCFHMLRKRLVNHDKNGFFKIFSLVKTDGFFKKRCDFSVRKGKIVPAVTLSSERESSTGKNKS